MADGRTALQTNRTIPRPADQEVFASTSWRIGNTGRTKKHDYNSRFQMLYRVVYTDECIWRNPVAAFAAVSGHGAKRVAGFYDV